MKKRQVQSVFVNPAPFPSAVIFLTLGKNSRFRILIAWQTNAYTAGDLRPKRERNFFPVI